MSVTLTKDATVVVLPNPNYPGLLRPSRPQVKNAAIGGRVVVTDLSDGTNLLQPRLTWERLPKADYDSMESFIETTVKRSELSFTFEDWEANTWTVVYWDGIDEFGRAGFGHMAGTLTLREVPT